MQQSVVDLLSCVRVWQWSTAQSELIARHRITSDKSNEDVSNIEHISEVLDQIWRERRDKVREKRWDKIATWIHVPRNNVELCKVCFQAMHEKP